MNAGKLKGKPDKAMLVFIIPLKSATVSASWERVSRLFFRTAASACAQTSPEFRVVVACHEIPEGNFSHPGIEFIQVAHPIPSRENFREREADKQRKQLAALRRAREYSPSHVMFLDSDDLVSNRLAEFVARHRDVNGWYLRSGYFHSGRQSHLHLERRRFDQWCGSAHILRPELLDSLVQSNDYLVYDHRRLAQAMRERGSPLRPLPFRGAIYTVSHGETLNDYEPILWPGHPVWKPVRRLLFHRAITPAIRSEFGLYPIE